MQFKGWTSLLFHIDAVVKKYGKILLTNSLKLEDIHIPSDVNYDVCIDDEPVQMMKLGHIKSSQSDLGDVLAYLHIWLESQQRSIELAKQVLQLVQSTSLIKWSQEIVTNLERELFLVQDAVSNLK